MYTEIEGTIKGEINFDEEAEFLSRIATALGASYCYREGEYYIAQNKKGEILVKLKTKVQYGGFPR